MAKSAASPPHVRRWLSLVYGLPVLLVLGIVGYYIYSRAAHVPPPERLISTKPFTTVKVGGLTASLFTQGDQLRASGNDLYIDFRDAQGELTNVGNVTFALALTMPGMVMHSIGKVFSTSTPGRFRTSVQPQMGGQWTALLAFTNAAGGAATNFVLTVK